MSCTEVEFTKAAVVVHLPLDLGLKGVLIQLYIDSSPGQFPSVLRNGFKTSELLHPDVFSMRITHSALLTNYDAAPQFVEPRYFERQVAIVPVYKFTFDHEIGIEYSPEIFLQIFSRFNVGKGMFEVFRLCFDAEKIRYQILHIAQFTFRIVQLIGDANALEIVPEAEMTDFYVTKRGIGVLSHRFTPIEAIVLTPQALRLSRSASLSKLDL
jgi:hypothetical protein